MKALPRISLLSLLLLTALVGAGITIVTLWREVAPLRVENQRLRDEVGELSVGDPTWLHAIRVETGNQLEWKWRVWVPEGREYRLRSYGDSVSTAGFPGSGATIYIRDPGEHVVRYVIEYDPVSDRWVGSLKTKGASAGADSQPWVTAKSKATSSTGVGTATVSRPADAVFELIRLRVGENVNSSSAIPDPAPGVHVWLEPIE